MQALAFGNSARVTDGILDAHHHTTTIEIKKIEKGKEKVINNIVGKDLYKKVLNVSVPNKQLEPVRYYSPNMSSDKQDFRWCLDIESDLFQKQLYLKDNFMTKIHFNTGTFYAENITEGKYQFVAGSKVHSFNRQIGRPTLKIELSQNENLVISGLDKEIKLPYETGVSYSISINNLPPKEMMDINHFAFYYDAVKTDVPRFMPVLVQKASFMPHPHPAVCEAAIFGKSSIN
ncbi:MAG: hypothetical protein FD167_843 [bacterium]|nr:MAG: hypothetical protein FD167_843 [bacterium]